MGKGKAICPECGHEIPDQLAERWDGIAIAAAQQEWDLHYRNRRMEEFEEHGGIKKIKRVFASIAHEIPASLADYEALTGKLTSAGEQQQAAGDILQRMQGLAKAYYEEKAFVDKRWDR